MPGLTPPNTVTKTSHAMTIIAKGVPIGAINGWNPRMSREIATLYEFGVVTPGGAGPGLSAQYSKMSGEPFEKVPGNVTDLTIEITRYDIYTTPMEIVFGTPDLHTLANQQNAFDVRENWVSPNGANNYLNWYQGCWFASLGRQLQSTGDRIVSVSATLHYTSRTRIPQ